MDLLNAGQRNPITSTVRVQGLVLLCVFCTQPLLAADPVPPVTIEYENPVWDGYLADPQVLKTGGEYYAYGTGPAYQGRQFPVLHSKDFAKWEFVGNALETLADSKVKAYWAPEVAERDGKFYLYYAGEYQMRVAVADHPAGPFQDTGRILFPEEPFSIDGHPYRDPKSGKWFLFFAKDFLDQRVGTALAVAELSDDMTSIAGPVKTVLRAVGDWQIYERNRTMYGRVFDAWHTVEAPFVVLRDGRYYCFYSGGNWQTPGYGVGFAVSDQVTGPYKDEADLEGATVLKSIPGKLIGPGHNSVILGPDDRTYFIAYHSWNPERTRRQMCLDPIEWTPQGPRAFEPSRGKKTISLPFQAKGDVTQDDADSRKQSANPIMPGADPHALVVGDTIWIYPTWSPGRGERFFAFSSTDFTNWQRHGPVLDFKDITWINDDGQRRHSAWAPSVLARDGKYYFYYSVGPQNPTPSRIGVAVGDAPAGPFRDCGKPLLTGGDGFEAIDPMVFADPQSGRTYLYAGGSAGAKLRVFELNADLVSLAREIPVETPPQFTEGVFMHYRDGRYYLSYSSGGWQYSSYSVHYATADTPTGPWTYRGVILAGDATRKGPGHHSFIRSPLTGEWQIVYHRWENQTGDGPYRGSRQICIDAVEYDPNGLIRPILMTGQAAAETQRGLKGQT